MDRIDIAKLLDSVRGQIRDQVVGLILMQPFWKQRFGPGIADRLTVEVDSSLVALAKSIRYGSPMLFADQIRWQRDQLQGIGCATGHIREIATEIWNVVSGRLPAEALPALTGSIQAALDGLSYTGVAQGIAVLHADLAEALAVATFDGHWHWQMAYGPAGRDRAVYEAWFFIDYVIDALGSGKVDILRQELIWMRQDLTSRGLSSLHVRQLAWLFAEAAVARLPAGAAADLRRAMESALPAINDSAPSCQALLDAQEPIVAAVFGQLVAAGLSQPGDQTPAEVGWYLAYLSDSIAASTPGPICGYTRQLQHWHSSHGLPATLLQHSYQALSAAIGAHMPERAAREAAAMLQEAQRLL
jgi:hypothetical protein